MHGTKKSSRLVRAVAIIAVFSIAATFAAFAVGCSGEKYQTECLVSLGTAITLVAYADDGTFAKLLDGTKSILSEAEDLNGNGFLAEFNKAGYGERTETSREIFSLLTAIKTDEIYDGYNPLMAPLVDLWGFSVRNFSDKKPYDRERNEDGSLPLPDERYVEAFLSLTDLDGLELVEEEGKYYCTKNIPSVTVDGREYFAQMDLGGWIKGYCTDRIRELYASFGIRYGYISFGTSSVCLLENKTGDWTLALTDPDDTEKTYYKLKLSDGCASTSGDYENCYFVDGQRYCHIIGKDGRPVNNARCVTVIGNSAAEADVLSTALMTARVDELGEKAAKLKERGYRVVFYDGEIADTEGL